MKTTTETLVECPECGRPNFTARGLKAHQGNKNCNVGRSTIAHLVSDPLGSATMHVTLDHAEPWMLRRAVTRLEPQDEQRRKQLTDALIAKEPITLRHGAQTVDLGETQVPLLDGEVQVLPPPKLEDLEEIAAQIRKLHEEVLEQERQFHNKTIYSRVAMGLCLLKAREVHALKGGRPSEEETDETVSSVSEEGFQGWFRETFVAGKFEDEAEENKAFKSQIRNAQNYMNAARNAGLTSDHTLADVETLRANKALHHLTAKELYKLQDKSQPDGGDEQPPEVNLPEEAMRRLFDVFEETLTLLSETPANVYEAIHVRGKEWLEKYVGCELHYDAAGPAKMKRKRKKKAAAKKAKGARK